MSMNIRNPTASTSYDTAMLALKNQPASNQKMTDQKMTGQKTGDMKKAAQDFEAMFVSQMMNTMFEGIDVDPLFGGGHGEEMFRSMLVNEYSQQIAHGPGLGISDQIQKAMIEMQSKQH